MKVSGQPGFSQVIWPRSHGAFDLLMVAQQKLEAVFLNNALDVIPKTPLVTGRGRYALEHAVLARDFPVLRFTLELQVTGDLENVTAVIAA